MLEFVYTVVFLLMKLTLIHPNECVLFAAKLYSRMTDFSAKSGRNIFERQLQHKLSLKWKSYTILHHKKFIPLIGWAKYQIQLKDFVRVELLDFLSAYQTEKEIRGLLVGI